MTERFFRDSMQGFCWVLSGNLIQFLLRGATTVVLARLLAPEAFGLIATAAIFVGLCQMMAELGVGPALVQRTDLNDDHIATARAMALAVSTIAVTAIYISAGPLGEFFRLPMLPSVLHASSIAVIVTSLGIVPEGLLSRKMRFNRLAQANVVSFTVAYGGVGVSTAILGMGVWSLVLAQLANAVVSVVLLRLFCPLPRGGRVSGRAALDLLSFGGGLTMGKLANYAALQADGFVVSRILGAEPMGFYNRAGAMVNMAPKIIGQAMDKVLFAGLSSLKSGGGDLGTHYLRVMAMSLFALPALGAVVFALAPDIVLVLLGSQWTPCIPLFRIMSLAIVFRIGYKAGVVVLNALGRVGLIFYTQVFFAIMILVAAWLGSFAGITGVAAAVSLAMLLQYLVIQSVTVHVCKPPGGALFRLHFVGLLVFLAVGGIALFTRMLLLHLTSSSPVILVGTLGIVALCCVGLHRLLHGYLGPEHRWWLTKLRANLPFLSRMV